MRRLRGLLVCARPPHMRYDTDSPTTPRWEVASAVQSRRRRTGFKVNGAALQQLVAPHGWGNSAGGGHAHQPTHLPLAREGPGVDACASACCLSVSHRGGSPSPQGGVPTVRPRILACQSPCMSAAAQSSSSRSCTGMLAANASLPPPPPSRRALRIPLSRSASASAAACAAPSRTGEGPR
jgi:hypothetical protein